jgi:alpha-1,2-mannosyltransferase
LKPIWTIWRRPGSGLGVLALYALVVLICLLAYELKLAGKMPDFAVYHRAGARFLRAEALYVEEDGHYQFKYPPVAALVFAPLSCAPIGVAKALWLCLSGLALVHSLRLSGRLAARSDQPFWGLAALTILVEAKFFGHELTLGQVNAILLLALLLMTQALVDDRHARAGFWLALVSAVKPYALVFLPYLVCRRRLKAVAAALAGMLVLLVAPSLRYGWTGNLELLARWRETLGKSTPALLTSNDNVSLAGFFAKWGVTPSVIPVAVVAVGGMLLLLVLWAALRPRQERLPGLGQEVAALLILMPLLSPLGWDYVFLWSTPGVMLLLAGWRELPRGGRVGLGLVLLLIGGSLYDVMGRTLYRSFMSLSLLTPCFVILVLLLVWRRAVLASRP